MSARILTAYLATAAILAGVFTQAAAKPPQLPVKLSIECEPPPAQNVQRVYPVADLVIPIESAPISDASAPPFGGYPTLPECCPPAAKACCPAGLNATPAPAKYEPVPISGKREQVKQPPTMYPQAAYQHHPEPVRAENAQVPFCPFGCMGKYEGKDILVHVQEMPTGNLLFGVGVNSDAGVTGSVAVKAAANPPHGGRRAVSSMIHVPSECNERNFDTVRAEPVPMPTPAPCPAPCCGIVRTPRPQKTLEDQLIKLIVHTIKPESWSENGGSGTIDYFPLGMALVINQTPDVQEQVADLFASLRRLQDVEVAVEVRFVTVPAPFYGQVVNDLGLKLIKCQKETCPGPCPAACSKACCKDSPGEGLAFLNASQVAKFYDKIQADPHTNVMQSPKMTMFNGQESTINIMDTQFFVTSMNFRWIGDQVVCCPVNEPVSTGLEMTIQPVVSADKRYVRLSWDASHTDLAMPVPLCPITCITPIFEGSAKGQPEPFTMFIQEPSLCRQNVHKTVSIPDGGTVLLPAWTTCREVPKEVETPIWSQLPYVGRLFKQVGHSKETTTTVMLVTPRIICGSEDKAAPVAAADSGPTVIENLQKLERAQRLFKKAEQCRRRGEMEHAARCYVAVRQLCPGSRIAQLATRRCQQLHAAEATPEPIQSAARVDSLGRAILAANPQIGMKPMFLVVGSPKPEIFHKRTGELFITEGLVNQCKTDGELAALLYHELGKMVSERETEATPEPCPNAPAVLAPPSVANYHKEAMEFMAKYYDYCAQDRLAEATQWAIKALAIDPACFSKERDKKVSHPMLNAN